MELYTTLTDLLADVRARDREIRFIDGDKDESAVRFPDLWDRALTLLGALQSRGIEAGDELVIFSRSNEEFVIAFWAAVLGGIVPVPVAVGISDEHRLKLFRILTQLDNPTLFTEADLQQRLQEFAAKRDLHDVERILQQRSVLMSSIETAAPGSVHAASPEDTVFIQYSSGSTSDPKGVVLSHRNLCTNIRAIIEGAEWGPDDQALSWMPLTHDMGLIGFHLSVLGAGMNHAVMDTNLFVRRPLLWMSKASELHATQLCSPNFGYKHFLKLFVRKGLPDVDLSSVKNVLNGAEPISWELCEEFLDALAPLGLVRSSMMPVYGLAEATVGVSFRKPGSGIDRIVAERHSLKVGKPYQTAEPHEADAVSFLKVGTAIRDVEIRICDDDDRVLEDGHVGNIQLFGGSMAERVYGDAAATDALHTPDGWLRTGDCGVIAGGELVVTGREKDIIIVNGQNYYPHDIEEIVAGLDELDLNKVVIAGATPRGGRTEALLAFILHRKSTHEFLPLAAKIRDCVGAQTGLEVDHVIPVARIPKTTSGKVQRAKLLQSWADGEFDAVLAELKPDNADAGAEDADPLVAELESICLEFSKDRRIGPDDNLFEVGVSSLTLTEIVLAIDEKYPGKLDISDLFDYPTLREVAAFLRH